MSGPMEHAFDTPGPVRLRVSIGSGNVEVETGLVDRTEIVLTPLNRGAHDVIGEVAVRCLEVHDGYEVEIEEPKKWGFVSGILHNAEIGVLVRCPVGTSVETKTGSADVTVRGEVSSGQAKSGSGDVSFDAVTGELQVNVASGDVRVSQVGGGCMIKTASGDVRVGRVDGDFAGSLVSGDLRLEDARASVAVTSVSGDQWIGAVSGGEIRLQAVSGDVRVGVRPGLRLWIDATSVSGDMSSDLDAADAPPAGDGPLVQLRAKTVSGDVQITRAA